MSGGLTRCRNLAALAAFCAVSVACSPGERVAVGDDWYEIVSHRPGPEVTDPSMRRKIEESGQPWKVRDRATGIEMVLVMPGEFLMGSPDSEGGRNADEGPRHRVLLTRAFFLGVTEVTQAQWERLMGPTKNFFTGPSLPAEPSLLDVQAFLAEANEDDASGVNALRLPTEAEWEYACRAGTRGPFNFDAPVGQSALNFNDGIPRKGVVVDGKLEVEWDKAPSDAFRMSTAPVGSLPPNAWGLHEMHGNLWEWTADAYREDAYSSRSAVSVDPLVRTAAKESHTVRGGSWYDPAAKNRSAVRDEAAVFVRSNRIGFRVARTP